MSKRQRTPLPKEHWRYSSRKADQPVCQCGKGYGSKLDGLCIFCRGCTAWEKHMKGKP